MLNRISLATIVAVLFGMFATATASAAVPDRPPLPPPTDFWQNKGFMNMAHQGGELEAPGNTLYAFKTAVKYRGADTLEMDGYLTKDGKFVITHDMEPYKTSNAPNSADFEIRDLTLAELKEYDFAYKFKPGTGHYGYPHGGAADSQYIYRGIATGDKAPPAGFSANDFKIATFEEVLDAFPNTPINVDMKAPRATPELADETAVEVARIMNARPERSEDVIVASFFQGAMEKFHELAPNHKALSGSEQATIGYFVGYPLTPTPVAVQPPDLFRTDSSAPFLRTVPALKDAADHDGYAIHVWGSGNDPLEETAPFYARLIEEGADGYFTQEPGELHKYLCEAGIRRPDGTQRCSSQAPDVIPASPAKLKLHWVKTTSGAKTRAGKKTTLTVLLQNTGGTQLDGVKVCVNVPKNKRKMVKAPGCTKAVSIPANGVRTVNVKLKSTRKAKGKVKVRVDASSTNGGKASKNTNPLYVASGNSGSNPLHR